MVFASTPGWPQTTWGKDGKDSRFKGGRRPGAGKGGGQAAVGEDGSQFFSYVHDGPMTVGVTMSDDDGDHDDVNDLPAAAEEEDDDGDGGFR